MDEYGDFDHNDPHNHTPAIDTSDDQPASIDSMAIERSPQHGDALGSVYYGNLRPFVVIDEYPIMVYSKNCRLSFI